MTPWCEAYVLVVGAWQPCKAPAIAAYRYDCANGHHFTRSVCVDHDPVPGQVGCRYCQQLGLEVPLTWQLVDVADVRPQQ